jgi:hypothetical protein
MNRPWYKQVVTGICYAICVLFIIPMAVTFLCVCYAIFLEIANGWSSILSGLKSIGIFVACVTAIVGFCFAYDWASK